jgi:hypothetical protein
MINSMPNFHTSLHTQGDPLPEIAKPKLETGRIDCFVTIVH